MTVRSVKEPKTADRQKELLAWLESIVKGGYTPRDERAGHVVGEEYLMVQLLLGIQLSEM